MKLQWHTYTGIISLLGGEYHQASIKAKGYQQPKEIVRVMNTQKIGTAKMENEDGQEIIIRRCTEPTVAVKQIYEALKYKQKPYCQKKFVVPQTKSKIMKPLIIKDSVLDNCNVGYVSCSQ